MKKMFTWTRFALIALAFTNMTFLIVGVIGFTILSAVVDFTGFTLWFTGALLGVFGYSLLSGFIISLPKVEGSENKFRGLHLVRLVWYVVLMVWSVCVVGTYIAAIVYYAIFWVPPGPGLGDWNLAFFIMCIFALIIIGAIHALLAAVLIYTGVTKGAYQAIELVISGKAKLSDVASALPPTFPAGRSRLLSSSDLD